MRASRETIFAFTRHSAADVTNISRSDNFKLFVGIAGVIFLLLLLQPCGTQAVPSLSGAGVCDTPRPSNVHLAITTGRLDTKTDPIGSITHASD